MPRQSVRAAALHARRRRPATEKELRRQLCDFVRRGYRQRLLISTEGSFSARLDELVPDHALAARTAARSTSTTSCWCATAPREAGKTPAARRGSTRRSTARHPQVARHRERLPVNATAFSVTGAPLDSRTIPESYIFLRDVARVPYGVQFGDGTSCRRATLAGAARSRCWRTTACWSAARACSTPSTGWKCSNRPPRRSCRLRAASTPPAS